MSQFMTAIITVAVFMWKTFLLASTLGFMILDSGVNNTGASGAKRGYLSMPTKCELFSLFSFCTIWHVETGLTKIMSASWHSKPKLETVVEKY